MDNIIFLLKVIRNYIMILIIVYIVVKWINNLSEMKNLKFLIWKNLISSIYDYRIGLKIEGIVVFVDLC